MVIHLASTWLEPGVSLITYSASCATHTGQDGSLPGTPRFSGLTVQDLEHLCENIYLDVRFLIIISGKSRLSLSGNSLWELERSQDLEVSKVRACTLSSKPSWGIYTVNLHAGMQANNVIQLGPSPNLDP